MAEQANPTSSQEIEKTVLRHPEGIQPAIICTVVLACMVQFLISLLQGHDISDVVYVIFLWSIAFLVVASVFVWSVVGSTVLRKQFGLLTMSIALGRFVLWDIKSVPLPDLKNVVIRERA
jgi:hypothetical protein